MEHNLDSQKTKNYPLAAFALIFATIVGAILYYTPSWGLQDDIQSLGIAQAVWASDHFFKSLWGVIMSDFSNWGIFRPVYYSTVVITYHFLKDIPWLIYIFVAIFNFLALYFWGVVLARTFQLKGQMVKVATFIFPLSFLVFTPFWNIFNHISFQEKYIVLFSGLSLLFLEKAYRNNTVKDLIGVALFLILSLLSKPTAIHFAIACIVFAICDLMILKYNKKISSWLFGLNTGIFVVYYWFITTNLRNYSGQYNLSVGSVVQSLTNSPAIVKLLIVLALIMGLTSLIVIMCKKNDFSPLILMFPLGLISYILVLAPWRFVNYLLSAIAPYTLAVLFPVFIWLCAKNRKLAIFANASLMLLVLTSVMYIGIPRIAKLAEIKEAQNFIASFNQNDHKYFFPPPFSEAAWAIATYSGADVQYLSDGVLDRNDLARMPNNYLIVNDEAGTVQLNNVKIDKRVYQNNTWQIYEVAYNGQDQSYFKVDFPENPVEKVKTYLGGL